MQFSLHGQQGEGVFWAWLMMVWFSKSQMEWGLAVILSWQQHQAIWSTKVDSISLIVLLLDSLIPPAFFLRWLSLDHEEFTLNPLSEIGYKVGELSSEVKMFCLLLISMNREDDFSKVLFSLLWLRPRLILGVGGRSLFEHQIGAISCVPTYSTPNRSKKQSIKSWYSTIKLHFSKNFTSGASEISLKMKIILSKHFGKIP